MTENVVALYSLPLGIATNFRINSRDYLIPLVIEEASVIAGASNAARLLREGAGIQTSSDSPLMIGQIQLLDLPDTKNAISNIESQREEILALADENSAGLKGRGGGARDLQIRELRHPNIGPMLVIHLLMDCRDAMGANALNHALESIAPRLATISRGRAVLRILSNLSDRRLARANGKVPATRLQSAQNEDEIPIAQRIVEAAALAEIDPYRAATHNKGIMNGIDALMLATGNDWRAVAAGAHAYAARSGSYRSLSRWWLDERGDLCGFLEMPLALGTVGGATRAHPGASTALALLGVDSAQQLAEVAAAVGLVQNLAALYALAGEGIQQGHMRLHARQIALATGAPIQKVASLAKTIVTDGQIRPSRARDLQTKSQDRATTDENTG